jgi:hypothetical protein
MMNFALGAFVWALKTIDQEIRVCSSNTLQGTLLLIEADRIRISENFKFIAQTCRNLSLQAAEHRLDRLAIELGASPNYPSLAKEFVALREAIEDDIQYERFYHYPRALSLLPISVQGDWAPTLAAFPSKGIKDEIESGVDCYALDHPTAAIFHFMRVAEHGLRALAYERGVRLVKNKPVEWATWGDILKEIEKAKVAIEQKTAGPKKDAALDFYSGALAHFNGFKDQYRNMVMHVRRIYEPWEAEMAMRQVRDFMNKLSSKIGESTKRPLKWGI